MAEWPWNRVGKKLTVGEKRVLHPVFLPLHCTESLIRTCHRSNEYHLNCFVYGSEFGCRFNLRMCLRSCAWRGGRTESGSLNETPAPVTGWRAPTRSYGFERKFWQSSRGRESIAHSSVETERWTRDAGMRQNIHSCARILMCPFAYKRD